MIEKSTQRPVLQFELRQEHQFFILTPLDYVAIFRELLGDEGFANRKDLKFHNLNPVRAH